MLGQGEYRIVELAGDVKTVIRYWREPVDTQANLPATGNEVGDARIVKDTNELFTWDGNNWVKISGSSDHKVLADVNDPAEGFLDAKTDNTTIEVDATNHVLKVKDGVFAAHDHSHSFVDLTDTPTDYTGQGGKVVTVKNTEDGLEFSNLATSDEKVKVTENDTTPSVLNDKMLAGEGINLTVLNANDNEILEVKARVDDLTIGFTEGGALKVKDNVFAAYDHTHSFLDLEDTPTDYTGHSGKVVMVNTTEDGLEFGEVAGTDEKTKVSGTDTTTGYLNEKLVAGSGIILTVLNANGDEDLEVKASVDDTTITFNASNQLKVKDNVFADKTHSHVEADITDLVHDAQKIKGKTINDSNIGDSKILRYNAADDVLEYVDDNAHSHSFLSLTDTPASYSGHGGKIVKVKTTEDGLEFVEDSGGGTPSGGNGSVQYNDNGVFGGDDKLVWDKNNIRLGIGTSTPERSLDIRGDSSNPSNAFQMGCDELGNLNLEFRGINKAIYIDFAYTDNADYDWRIITNNGDTNFNIFGNDGATKFVLEQNGHAHVKRALEIGGVNAWHYPNLSINSNPPAGSGGSSEINLCGPSNNTNYDNAYVNFAKKSSGEGKLTFRSVWVNDSFGLSEWFNVFTLHENGNATLTGTLTQGSDRRLKKNIQPLKIGLKEVLRLNPVQYDRRDDTEKNLFGLIADEVKQVIPNVVKEIQTKNKQGERLLGVQYHSLIPVLVNAVKELHEIIMRMSEKIKKLKEYNNC